MRRPIPAHSFERANLAPSSHFIWTDAPIVGAQLPLLDDFILMTWRLT